MLGIYSPHVLTRVCLRVCMSVCARVRVYVSHFITVKGIPLIEGGEDDFHTRSVLKNLPNKWWRTAEELWSSILRGGQDVKSSAP
jgi:hypothetical protein